MPPTVATEAASATRRVWPTTALLVLLACLLMVYQLLAGALMVYLGFLLPLSSVFFPDTPDGGDFIPAAMAALTTLPAFAAMVWCGWQRGSRLGLLLVSGPAALMTLVGLNLLDTPPVTLHSPQPRRALSLMDLFGDLTLLNWAAVVVFVAVAVATHLQRRRARRTQEVSAT
jgi:hypothetical protein